MLKFDRGEEHRLRLYRVCCIESASDTCFNYGIRASIFHEEKIAICGIHLEDSRLLRAK